MKVLVYDSPVNEPVNEPVLLKENEIQGLYPFKNSCQSFWTLKAKIELAIFNDHKKEVKQNNE
jgi:hypothetical protein